MKFLEGCTLACCSKTNPICFKWTGVDKWTPIGGLGGYCAAHAAVGTEVARVVCCCPPGSVKGSLPAEPPCMCKEPCGRKKECCQPDEYCSRGLGCQPCAEDPKNTLCGKHCCTPKQSCRDAALGLCCNDRTSKSPQEACIAVNPIRRARKGLCCDEGQSCCHFVDDAKGILRVDCCTSTERCVKGMCV
jgi:hypothetical protein